MGETTEKQQITIGDLPTICAECDWQGPLSDSGAQTEDGDWVLLNHEILICPLCGGSCRRGK